jgi:hypothetical protein
LSRDSRVLIGRGGVLRGHGDGTQQAVMGTIGGLQILSTRDAH